MNIEHDGIIRNFSAYEITQIAENRAIEENRRSAIEAGNFLNSSGINDSIIDFKQGFLGDMGNLTNEIYYEAIGNVFNASIVLDWIDPDELKHLKIKVSAGSSSYKERYMALSYKEIPHYRYKKYDTLIHEIYLLHFGNEFNFVKPVSESERKRYKEWLNEKVLNYQHVWGDI